MTEFPVERGMIGIFAEAIGDLNPVYRSVDATRAAGFSDVLAPPTFIRASSHFDPGYPLRPRIGQPWFGSGREPSGAGSKEGASKQRGTTLHAEQHFEYHHPLCAGELLTTRSQAGRTWSKQGRRSGPLQFAESITEYLDASGELVITARSVSVVTQRPVGEKLS